MKTFDVKLFNEIASDAEKLLAEIETISHNPAEISEKLLLKIIHDNESTEYGKKYNFASINSYDDFKKFVPITEYGDYHAYIKKMLENGETGLITNYPVVHYATSSGSVGVPKSIPVSKYGMDEICDYGGKIKFAFMKRALDAVGCKPGWVVCLVDCNTDVVKSCVTRGAISAHNEDWLANKMENIFAFPRELQVPTKPIENSMYLKALFALRYKNVSCISTTFSSSINEFFNVIQNNWQDLVNDIRTGNIASLVDSSDERDIALRNALEADPKRADELEKEFLKGFDTPILPRIWPNCKLIVAIGGSFFAEHTENSRKFIGDVPYFHYVYAASEAIMGAALDIEDTNYTLLAHRNFFEFLPIGEEDFSKTLTINQLEVGKRYEIIVTNPSGFYRYRMMDVIEITGFYNKLPKGFIPYRLNQVINMVGEKTNNEQLQYVVKNLAKLLNNAIVDYSIYPDYAVTPACYVLFIEPAKDIGKGLHDELREAVDKLLLEANVSYGKYRHGNVMGLPYVVALEPQTYQLFRELQIMSGTSRNQVKPVRVIDNPQKIRFFIGLATDKELADFCVDEYKKLHRK